MDTFILSLQLWHQWSVAFQQILGPMKTHSSYYHSYQNIQISKLIPVLVGETKLSLVAFHLCDLCDQFLFVTFFLWAATCFTSCHRPK